jgi:hypothetical protein
MHGCRENNTIVIPAGHSDGYGKFPVRGRVKDVVREQKGDVGLQRSYTLLQPSSSVQTENKFAETVVKIEKVA